MPRPTIGANAWAQFILEQTYAGTAAAGGLKQVALISSGLKPMAEEFAADPSLGGMADKDPYVKLQRGAGDIPFALRYEGFDNIWHSFFGQIKDEAGPTNYTRFYYPYPTQNAYQKGVAAESAGYRSMRFDLVNPAAASDYGMRFLGMLVQNLKFNITNQSAICTVGFLGKAPITLSADPGTPTFPTAALLMGGDACSLRVVDRTAVGSPVTWNFQSADINLGIPKSEDREFVGSFAMQEPVLAGKMTGSISVVHEYQDSAAAGTAGGIGLTRWALPAIHELSFKWVKGNAEFELYFPSCIASSLGPEIGDNGVVVETVNFTPYWETSTTGRNASLDISTTKVPTIVYLRTKNTIVSVPVIT